MPVVPNPNDFAGARIRCIRRIVAVCAVDRQHPIIDIGVRREVWLGVNPYAPRDGFAGTGPVDLPKVRIQPLQQLSNTFHRSLIRMNADEVLVDTWQWELDHLQLLPPGAPSIVRQFLEEKPLIRTERPQCELRRPIARLDEARILDLFNVLVIFPFQRVRSASSVS